MVGKIPTEEVPVLTDLADKTYMSVWTITDPTSEQYNYIHRSGEVRIDDRGFLLCDGAYIGCALGDYFGEIGTKYVFTLDSGKQLKVCKVEHKADKDTDADNYAAIDNGDVIEFVVDTSKSYMQKNIHENGLIFSGNFNNCPRFEGRIVRIERVKE